MKKNGFTLVELLGVMVILALLMLFAFPKIINQVKSSTNSTDEFTEKLIYNAMDLYMDDNKNMFVKDNEINYCIPLSTLVDNGYLKGPIKLNGSDTDVTSLKTVEVSYNGQYDFELKDNSDCSGSKFFSDGQVVYFDVKSGEKCTNYTSNNSKDGYNGINNVSSTQNSCLKFYAFLDNGGYDVNLILDHNVSTSVTAEYNVETVTNGKGPLKSIESLKSKTKDWKGTSTPSNYTYKSSSIEYTIDYSDFKSRLITANEVAKIAGIDFEEGTQKGLFVKVPLISDSFSTAEANKKLKVLCDDITSSSCEYVTSSAIQNTYGSFWTVRGKYLGYGVIKSIDEYGVRPVIEVKRNKIS